MCVRYEVLSLCFCFPQQYPFPPPLFFVCRAANHIVGSYLVPHVLLVVSREGRKRSRRREEKKKRKRQTPLLYLRSLLPRRPALRLRNTVQIYLLSSGILRHFTTKRKGERRSVCTLLHPTQGSGFWFVVVISDATADPALPQAHIRHSRGGGNGVHVTVGTVPYP